MTTHIMLDLETWGRTPGSDIRSIGAVVFDPTQSGGNRFNKPELQFYIACDNPIVSSSYYAGDFSITMKYPLTREHETVQWWNEQSPEAQAAFNNPIDLFHALNSFSFFLKEVAAGTLVDDLRIWANDPNFDVSILEAAYRAVGLPHPWHYRAPRSFRTVVELSGMSRDDMRQFDTGTAHNALDDAISQAKIVCEAYKRLGLTSEPRQEYSIAWNERKTIGIIVKEDDEHRGLTYELRKGSETNTLGVVTRQFMEGWAEQTLNDNCTIQKGVIL